MDLGRFAAVPHWSLRSACWRSVKNADSMMSVVGSGDSGDSQPQ
ncbi:hypothetical protein ABIA31_007995 [Catenulispora sp. MAP5-51]